MRGFCRDSASAAVESVKRKRVPDESGGTEVSVRARVCVCVPLSLARRCKGVRARAFQKKGREVLEQAQLFLRVHESRPTLTRVRKRVIPRLCENASAAERIRDATRIPKRQFFLPAVCTFFFARARSRFPLLRVSFSLFAVRCVYTRTCTHAHTHTHTYACACVRAHTSRRDARCD